MKKFNLLKVLFGHIRIKGYNLDAQVKRISLLGAGPETTAEEIRQTLLQLGMVRLWN